MSKPGLHSGLKSCFLYSDSVLFLRFIGKYKFDRAGANILSANINDKITTSVES